MYYISQGQYVVLLVLSALSAFQIWKDFCMRLFAVIKDRRSDADWSVVAEGAKQDDKKDDQDESHGCDWQALSRSLADTKISDFFSVLTVVFYEYRQQAFGQALWLWGIIKLAFWPLLSLIYMKSVWSVYQEYNPRCRQRDRRFLEVAKAYESLTDCEYYLGVTDCVQQDERDLPYHVNTADFVYRYFAINVVCWIGWYLVMKRFQLRDPSRSLLSAIRKDRWLQLLLIWFLFSTATLCSMLYLVWLETKSPFKILGLNPSASHREIK